MSNQARNIDIPATQSTPEIHADWQAGTLFMKGDSYPENTFDLFDQVIRWVEALLSETDTRLDVDLHLVYLNTSSIRAMIDMLDLLESAHGNGRSLGLRWYYDTRNRRVAELAEEFQEDYSFSFDILPLEG